MNNFNITDYFSHTLKKPKHFTTLFNNENNQRFSKIKIDKNKMYDFLQKSWPNFISDNDIVLYDNNNDMNIDDIYHNLNKYKGNPKKDIRIENFHFILYNYELKNDLISNNKRQKFGETTNKTIDKKEKFDQSNKIQKIFLCNNKNYKILCSSKKHKRSVYFYYITSEKEKKKNNIMTEINFDEVILMDNIIYYKLVGVQFYLITKNFIYCYNLKNNILDKINLNDNQYLINGSRFDINKNYFINYNSKTGILVICHDFDSNSIKSITIDKNLFIKIIFGDYLLVANDHKIEISDINTISDSVIFKKSKRELFFNISNREISEFSKCEYDINFKPSDILNIKIFGKNANVAYIFFDCYIIIYNFKNNTKRIIKFDSKIKSSKIYFDLIFIYELNGNFNILNIKGGKYKLELLKHKKNIGQKFSFVNRNLNKKFTFEKNIVTFYNFDKKYEIKLFN